MVTTFVLVYGQEAILPMEVNLDTLRIDRQDELSTVHYQNLMLDRLDEVSDERVNALGDIERHKLRVARAYNKRVKEKSFQVRDLIWKMILPIGSRSNKLGKWSPNCEGPYRIEEVILGNSYMVQSIQGTSLPRTLNRKYLKKYYPSIWQDAWVRKQPIMVLSPLVQKMADETPWISSQGQIWSKMHFNTQA
jgi:hypothetical protein